MVLVPQTTQNLFILRTLLFCRGQQKNVQRFTNHVPSCCSLHYTLFGDVLTVLSVRFEVGVSLLLAPAGADKRGTWGPFSSSGKCRSTAGDLQESTRRSSSWSQVLLKALSHSHHRLGLLKLHNGFPWASLPYTLINIL